MKREKKQLTKNDINRNSDKNISYSIKLMKKKERRYTFIFVILFLLLFSIIGYYSFKVDYDNFKGNYSFLNNYSLTLTSDDIMSDIDGIKKKGITIHYFNDSLEDSNYKIIYKKDVSFTKKCGCSDNTFNISDIRFSIDGISSNSFLNDEMIVTTKFIKANTMDSTNIKMWIDESIMSDSHYHGYFEYEKID